MNQKSNTESQNFRYSKTCKCTLYNIAVITNTYFVNLEYLYLISRLNIFYYKFRVKNLFMVYNNFNLLSFFSEYYTKNKKNV